MPPGPIEGSCLPSPTAISFAPERSTSSVRRVEAGVVGHPGLIEEDRRVRVDVDAPRLCAGDERVERERLPGQGGTVRAEPLGGGPGDSDPDRAVAGVLLGAGGGVDHDTLPGAGGADEDRARARDR